MTERVLSGAEVDAAWDDLGPFEKMRHKPQHAADFLRRFARAIEAAVLAKVNAGKSDHGPKYPAGHFVTERETRIRERAAWDAACAFWSQRFSTSSREERDRRYPLPTRRISREVRLSDGRIYSGAGSLDSFSGPLTPDDMRQLLALVKYPYDEVPDDA